MLLHHSVFLHVCVAIPRPQRCLQRPPRTLHTVTTRSRAKAGALDGGEVSCVPVVASPNCGVDHVLDLISAPDPPPPGKRQIAAKPRVSAARRRRARASWRHRARASWHLPAKAEPSPRAVTEGECHGDGPGGDSDRAAPSRPELLRRLEMPPRHRGLGSRQLAT